MKNEQIFDTFCTTSLAIRDAVAVENWGIFPKLNSEKMLEQAQGLQIKIALKLYIESEMKDSAQDLSVMRTVDKMGNIIIINEDFKLIDEQLKDYIENSSNFYLKRINDGFNPKSQRNVLMYKVNEFLKESKKQKNKIRTLAEKYK